MFIAGQKKAGQLREALQAVAYDKRGRIISIGHNSYIKTHPLQASIAASVGKQYKIYLHAEIDAIIRAKGQHIHKLFISRIGKSNQYLNAKPCSICAKAISLYGITHVEHT